jgi:hypothetical protein
MSFAEYVTEDRKCGKCGTAIEDFEGEPGLQVVNSSGWLVTLTAYYKLKPCGCAFAIATNQDKDL